LILDTSAIAAILFGEKERDLFIDAIEADPVRLISSVNALESAIVIEARKREQGGRELDLMLHKARVSVVPFTAEHMEEARVAWRIYGKGNHPAGLNFCDCCAYALSKLSGDKLLFKGNDFTHTDVAPVIQQSPARSAAAMKIDLGKTYCRQGFFNVPVEYDHLLGADGEAIEIHVEGLPPMIGSINRTAQRNGTARVMGRKALRSYFQATFHPGDQLTVLIESPRKIRLQAHGRARS
jgi:ribonuclease VapC